MVQGEGEGTGAGLAQLRKSNLQSQKELKRLREEMESLRKDNETLEQQMAQAQGTYGHRPGTGTGGAASGAGKRIQRARDVDARKDTVTSLEGKVGAEETRINQFDEKLVSLREQIMEVRRQMGSVNITKESNEMVDKQIRVLENRLDKALVKFNEALHVNKELREQIDNLRRERGVFDTIYKKLERELQEKKKEMAFIIEVSNIAYEERDNAQSELQQLKVYASKEMQSFEETFKELDELLDEDRKMKAAIKLRMNERRTDLLRSTTDLEASKGKRKGTPNTNTRQTTSAGGSGNGPSGADMTAQNYEEVFNALKTATNTTDITTLVEKFMHSEDDNFSLFNFVNELNTEIEKLEEQRSEIKTEMDSIKASAGVQGDQGRQAALKQLEERLNREEQNSKRYANMADKTSKLLEQAMGCVSKLFDVLECEESRIVEQQGTAGLSENTIHLYLAAIELKSDEHLARWRRLHGASDRGPAFPFGSTNITIDIPSTGDEYYDGYSDEEDRVLTREELLLKTSQKLAKQQQAGGERSRAKKGKKKAGLV